MSSTALLKDSEEEEAGPRLGPETFLSETSNGQRCLLCLGKRFHTDEDAAAHLVSKGHAKAAKKLARVRRAANLAEKSGDELQALAERKKEKKAEKLKRRKEKRSTKRKQKTESLTAAQIASRKAKATRKKQRRVERKAADSGS